MSRTMIKLTPVVLNEQELAHVLLGLRFLQIDTAWLSGQAQDACSNLLDDEGHDLMTNAEIDELCERINT